jgi:sulfide:quinone oxidoreductase
MSSRIVIAGTGLAGVEAVLGLRELAGDAVQITIVGPADELLHQPLGDAPWTMGGVHRHPIGAVADLLGVELVRDAVVEVDPGGRTVKLRQGGELGYDALLLALGARRVMALDHAVEFGSALDVPAVERVLDLIRRGAVRRLAVTVPVNAAWSLPAYEVALRAAAAGAEATIITPESKPVSVFGEEAAAVVAAELEAAGVQLVTGVVQDTEPGEVVLRDRSVDADAVVALPWLHGPRVAGMPHDPEGFLPTDPFCAVEGAEGVWAAGDGTSFPIRQGGIACQQAAVAAAAMAGAAGADVTAEPLRPVVRGALPTGSGTLWLEHDLAGGGSRASREPLWQPPHRVAGVRLPAFLERLEAG